MDCFEAGVQHKGFSCGSHWTFGNPRRVQKPPQTALMHIGGEHGGDTLNEWARAGSEDYRRNLQPAPDVIYSIATDRTPLVETSETDGRVCAFSDARWSSEDDLWHEFVSHSRRDNKVMVMNESGMAWYRDETTGD